MKYLGFGLAWIAPIITICMTFNVPEDKNQNTLIGCLLALVIGKLGAYFLGRCDSE